MYNYYVNSVIAVITDAKKEAIKTWPEEIKEPLNTFVDAQANFAKTANEAMLNAWKGAGTVFTNFCKVTGEK